MKPWREVLAEKGWERDEACHWAESWAMTCDGETWMVIFETVAGGVRPSVWRGGAECFEELDVVHLYEDAAFAALMAKPIGPGRVTVGVLLGVEV